MVAPKSCSRLDLESESSQSILRSSSILLQGAGMLGSSSDFVHYLLYRGPGKSSKPCKVCYFGYVV